MKRILISISLIVLIGVISFSRQAAKQITLQWDMMPAGEKWTEVRIYDVSTSPESLVMTYACTSAGACPTREVSFSVPRAAHSYVARSYDGFWESADSNMVAINAPPKIPSGLIKK